MKFKYSIVIPTRNRAHYLPYAIKSVLDSKRGDIELIVSDNFSTDETAELLSTLSDSRLKVFSPNTSLPMAGHYEFAISKATGEWITILGDDDAVMPYAFESLDRYIERFPEVDIISSERAYYFWEGCEDLYEDAVVNFKFKNSAKIRSTQNDLLFALAGLRSCFDLPQLYTTSMVKRSLYEEIKKKTGGFFYNSIIPDMYSAVALSFARATYLRVGEPLFWVGTSNKSLGRSDRIYRDAEQFSSSLEDGHVNVPREISKSVSYLLHSNAFSSMYIYECFVQCPLKSNLYDKKNIISVVLAAVLVASMRRDESESGIVIDEVWSECRRNSIPKIRVIFLASFLIIIGVVQRILQTPGWIARRIGLAANSLQVRVDRRKEFENILDASAAVLKLPFQNGRFQK